jgi:ribosomal-protein-alanine N-acetyltransferase
MYLEVAADNAAAMALYQSVGFVRTGLRRGYYDGADAVTMRAPLDSVGE